MSKVRVSITSVWVAFFLAACSGSSSSGPQTSQQGGSGAGGAAETGGANSGTTGTEGGTNAAGARNTGGTPAGGTGAAGTINPNGGAANTGGATSSVGGVQATGGTVAAGGLTTTGGTRTGVGGSSGTNVGGSNATGGTAATGGANAGNTGGKTGTGGTNAGNTGGTKAGTGGSPSGGAPATGGSSSSGPSCVTSAQNAYWQTATLTTVTSGTADVTVNISSTAQTWNGFGGTFNELGWKYLSLLSSADLSTALNLLFGTNGCRFAFGRVPIGASDYAIARYTDDEISSGTDYTMANFSITEDQQYLIPYIKAALAIKSDIHLWGSPWSPPTWMKSSPYTTPATVPSPFDGGTMKSDTQTLDAFALYLAKWVEAYAGQGITIETIMPQNEPNYSDNYPSCLWATSTYDAFIPILASTFTSQNVTANIYLGTMSNNDSGKDGTIVTTVTGDSTAMKYIKGFGLQWNMLPIVSGLTSKNLPIMQTEHKCGNYPWVTTAQAGPPAIGAFNANTAPNDYPYAVESWSYISSWIKAGVTSYSAWNMVLDTVGKNIDTTRPWPQNALLTVNTSAKTLNVTPVYYVFRHVSQFVDPGAIVMGTTTSSFDALAFKNPDGTIITVMYNSGAAKTSIVQVGSTKLQFTMPGNGFATVVSH